MSNNDEAVHEITCTKVRIEEVPVENWENGRVRVTVFDGDKTLKTFEIQGTPDTFMSRWAVRRKANLTVKDTVPKAS